MTESIELYDASTIERFVPDTDSETGQAALSIVPMIREGAQDYIDNVSTNLQLVTMGDLTLPISVGEYEPENAYVCSPYCHYVTYAKEELRHLPSPALRSPLAAMLSLLGTVLRWSQIDRTVYLDNWLVSTNLHPSLAKSQLAAITEFLVSRFPQHAVAIRSVNTRGDAKLLENAVSLGYAQVASRRVYYQDACSEVPFRTTSYRRDARLFEQSSYSVHAVHASDEVDPGRLVELYRRLYIEKYSRHNPKFNNRFVRMAIDRGLLDFFVLKQEERIDGVAGYFVRGGVMTTPFLGYDTRLPQGVGLYRMLSLLLLREARERRLLLHASSGAAGFKRARGGVDADEYTVVYTRHLPARRRSGWRLVGQLANRIGLPLMKKYRL